MLRKQWKRFSKSKLGATAIEYGLIAAGIAIVMSVVSVRGNISTSSPVGFLLRYYNVLPQDALQDAKTRTRVKLGVFNQPCAIEFAVFPHLHAIER